MRAVLLGLFAAPLAVIGASIPASAYPSFSIYGPGGYSGFYNQMGNFSTYRDNYGMTTCGRIGSSFHCF